MKKTNIFLTGLTISCALYISQIVLTHKYDWDIDQFMYFGSRLANGELAFTREYDDKSIAVHALFVIPFWLKSIRTWYIISTLAVAATGLLLYRKLLVNKRQAKGQAAISTMYFIFLLISTRGGINHINGIAACMTLACVCGIALAKNRKTKPKEAISISLYMLFGAWSISIRPYYIMSILTTIAWPPLKAALTNGNLLSEDRKNILDKNTILISLGRASLLVAFAAAINVLPYLITGEGKALGDAFQINKVSITPGIQEGIAGIFLVAIQKAPLISAPLIASNVLLIIKTIKGIGRKMFSKSKKTEPKGMVVAPVPIPPKDNELDSPRKDATGQPEENKVFTKVAPSVLSSDLKVKGNLLTTGDIQIEGIIEGDIQAHLLTVGETSKIKGEIIADDIIINGNVVGRVRGLKVRLTNKARVQGDIIHKAIAIETGAHFEGTVQRTDNPFENLPEKKK